MAPIPVFICQHCILADLSSCRRSTDPLSRATANELRALVRGCMHLFGASKRTSSERSYRSGRAAFQQFCDAFDFPPLPASPLTLMVWCTHALTVRTLDSSTIKQRLLAVGDVYDYCRERLSMRRLRNPLRDPQLIAMVRTIGINFKKPGGGSIAITVAELHGLFAHGFTSRTRRGLWARVYCIFLNFGMLRNTAVLSLKIVYEIRAGCVVFLPGSDVQVYHHPMFDATIIEISVTSDKNMNAQKASREGGRRAYIPASLPRLEIEPLADLQHYLITQRPPSGGPLFLYPNKKGTGFAAKTSGSTFNPLLRAAYKLAFPLVKPEYLKMLGSHSGRKTLAQLLWDNGWSRRVIADAGGWFLKKEAMDLYFKTSAHVILQALASLSLASPVHLPHVAMGD
jgi:hypothetical protein